MHHGVMFVPSSSDTASIAPDPSTSASSSAASRLFDNIIRPWGPPDFAGNVRKVFHDRAKLKLLGEVCHLASVLVSVSLLCQCFPAWIDVILLCLLNAGQVA